MRRFESRFERWAPDRQPPAAGGGTLLDFGSHLVDQALLLHGPASRVYAEMRGAGDLDDDVFVALHHVSGVESHLWGSWRQAAPGPRLRVTGTTGTYVVDGVDSQEALLKAGKSPAGLGERWGVEPEHAWGRLYRGMTGAAVRSERGRWDLFYPAFAAAVRGEGPGPGRPGRLGTRHDRAGRRPHQRTHRRSRTPLTSANQPTSASDGGRAGRLDGMVKRTKAPATTACPCGRGLPYAECCSPAHQGQASATAEALMRSRYSAFALDDDAYVLRTWHPHTRPAAIEPDPGLRWVGLDILESSGGGMFDAEGVVEFRAHFRDHGKHGDMVERSRFVRHDGQWVYWGPILTDGSLANI